MLTTTDGRRMPGYTISSPMSLRLRWAKNPQDRISIHLESRIIQGFSNIIRLVVFKRDTHSLKWFIYFFSLCMLLLLCVKHICAALTYGIDVKSSISKLSFWSRILVDCLQLEESQDNTVIPPQPGRWSQTTLYIDIFHRSIFLHPLTQF